MLIKEECYTRFLSAIYRNGDGADIAPPLHISINSRLDKSGPATYRRNGNYNFQLLEEGIGALEEGSALVFCSDQAALMAVILAGNYTVIESCNVGYFGTLDLLHEFRVDAVGDSALKRKLMVMESIQNPQLTRIDLVGEIPKCKRLGYDVCVDNTMATPFNVQPLGAGADYVVHSCTKLMSGFYDSLVGVVIVNDAKRFDRLKEVRDTLGTVPGILEAYNVTKGIASSRARLNQQSHSAMKIARWLANQPGISLLGHPRLSAGSQGARYDLPLVWVEFEEKRFSELNWGGL